MRPAWTEPNLLYSTLGIENRELRLAEYTLINVEDQRSVLFHDAVAGAAVGAVQGAGGGAEAKSGKVRGG